MVTKPQHTKSSEIGNITSNIKDLQEDPILVPISDYQKGSSFFEKEDERETSNLSRANDILKELKDTGIYDDSRIASAYKDVVELYIRIAWIYQKNVSLANKQISQIKQVVEKFYITKEEHLKSTNLLEKELEETKLEIKEEISLPENEKLQDEEQTEAEFLEEEITNG